MANIIYNDQDNTRVAVVPQPISVADNAAAIKQENLDRYGNDWAIDPATGLPRTQQLNEVVVTAKAKTPVAKMARDKYAGMSDLAVSALMQKEDAQKRLLIRNMNHGQDVVAKKILPFMLAPAAYMAYPLLTAEAAPFWSTAGKAASIGFGAQSAQHLLSKNGIRKTWNYLKNKDFNRAEFSALGDLADALIVGGAVKALRPAASALSRTEKAAEGIEGLPTKIEGANWEELEAAEEMKNATGSYPKTLEELYAYELKAEQAEKVALSGAKSVVKYEDPVFPESIEDLPEGIRGLEWGELEDAQAMKNATGRYPNTLEELYAYNDLVEQAEKAAQQAAKEAAKQADPEYQEYLRLLDRPIDFDHVDANEFEDISVFKLVNGRLPRSWRELEDFEPPMEAYVPKPKTPGVHLWVDSGDLMDAPYVDYFRKKFGRDPLTDLEFDDFMTSLTDEEHHHIIFD